MSEYDEYGKALDRIASLEGLVATMLETTLAASQHALGVSIARAEQAEATGDALLVAYTELEKELAAMKAPALPRDVA